MANKIQLNESDICKARAWACETHEQFKSSPGYYGNKIRRHLLGKIGEIACEKWLRDNDVACEPVFKDISRMQEADIIVGAKRLRVEVKAWSKDFWEDLGRCIAVKQLKRIKGKADVVLWCVACNKIEAGMTVTICGWNTLADIEQAPKGLTGLKGGNKVYNYQVAADKVKTPADFLVHIKTPT